jgi:hypothetical protein
MEPYQVRGDRVAVEIFRPEKILRVGLLQVLASAEK